MNAAKTLSIVAVALSVCVTLANAQESPAEQITKIVPIAHSDARTIAEALAIIEPGLSVSAAGPNLLVLRGPEVEVRRIVRDVVGPIETPQTRLMSEAAPIFIPLARTPNRDFRALVETVAPPGASTQVAIDNANRLLVMRGSDLQIEAVRNLVSELNRPTRSAVIHAYFLKGYISNCKADGSLPPVLTPVAKALSESGVYGATLLAPMIVKSTTGEHFRSDGNLSVEQSDGSIGTLKFQVSGHLNIDDHDGVQLQIEGTVATARENKAQLIFAIETTVTTQTGSYVILAAAPGTTPAGDCIAMVVRVVQAE